MPGYEPVYRTERAFTATLEKAEALLAPPVPSNQPPVPPSSNQGTAAAAVCALPPAFDPTAFFRQMQEMQQAVMQQAMQAAKAAGREAAEAASMAAAEAASQAAAAT